MKNPFVAIAKFQVSAVHTFGYRDHTNKPQVSRIEVVMNPIYGGKDDPDNENWKFTNATPCGEFKMQVDNPDLFEAFKVGQVYYLPMIDSDRAGLAAVSEALNSLPAEVSAQ